MTDIFFIIHCIINNTLNIAIILVVCVLGVRGCADVISSLAGRKGPLNGKWSAFM